MKAILNSLFPILILSFTSCSHENEYMYVNSQTGIVLFSQTNIESVYIRKIPFNTKLQIIRKGSHITNVGGTRGQWLYVGKKRNKKWIYMGWILNQTISRSRIRKIDIAKNIRKKYPQYKKLKIQYKRMRKGYGHIEGCLISPHHGKPVIANQKICALNLVTGESFYSKEIIDYEKYKSGSGFKMRIPVGIYFIYSYIIQKTGYPYIMRYYLVNWKKSLHLVKPNSFNRNIDLRIDPNDP